MNQNFLYMDIAEKIEIYIEAEGLEAHERLPSERVLCTLFEVNRMTVREAIKNLINEGLLYTIPGSGTYVAEKKIERNLMEFASFTKAMEQSGGILETKLLSVEKQPANKTIAKSLCIPLGTEVIKLYRLRKVNDYPLALENAYIPHEFCKGLEDREELQQGSLYEVLEKLYHIKLTRATQEVGILYLSEEESAYLDMKEGEAALLLKGVAYNEENVPVEYSESINRGDRCTFGSFLRMKPST